MSLLKCFFGCWIILIIKKGVNTTPDVWWLFDDSMSPKGIKCDKINFIAVTFIAWKRFEWKMSSCKKLYKLHDKYTVELFFFSFILMLGITGDKFIMKING